MSSAAAVIAGSERLENEDERSLRLRNVSNRKLLATQAAFVKRRQAFLWLSSRVVYVRDCLSLPCCTLKTQVPKL